MSFSQVEPSANPTHQVVARCVAGEDSAWRELHRTYGGVAWAFLARLGVPRASLDDTTQEVFLQVFRNLASFRGEADFRTWLYRVCMTQARKARRRAHLRSVLHQLFARTERDDQFATQRLPDSAEQRIEAALAQLSEGERAVFVLYELEGVPGKDVAEMVGCSEASVWRRLHYARQRFCTAVSGGTGFGTSSSKPRRESPP